jgi:hypothetical protein
MLIMGEHPSAPVANPPHGIAQADQATLNCSMFGGLLLPEPFSGSLRLVVKFVNATDDCLAGFL